MHSRRKEIIAELTYWQNYTPKSMAGNMLKVNSVRKYESELQSTVPAEWIIEQADKGEKFQ